jgi:hypothetical protein
MKEAESLRSQAEHEHEDEKRRALEEQAERKEQEAKRIKKKKAAGGLFCTVSDAGTEIHQTNDGSECIRRLRNAVKARDEDDP